MSVGIQVASRINLPFFSVFFVETDSSTADPAAEGETFGEGGSSSQDDVSLTLKPETRASLTSPIISAVMFAEMNHH